MKKKIILVVVPAQGAAPGAITLESVRAHAERALPHYALPRRLEIIDEMPRSVIGKVMRRQVREMLEGR